MRSCASNEVTARLNVRACTKIKIASEGVNLCMLYYWILSCSCIGLTLEQYNQQPEGAVYMVDLSDTSSIANLKHINRQVHGSKQF